MSPLVAYFVILNAMLTALLVVLLLVVSGAARRTRMRLRELRHDHDSLKSLEHSRWLLTAAAGDLLSLEKKVQSIETKLGHCDE